MPIIDVGSSTTRQTDAKQVPVSRSVTSNTHNPAQSHNGHTRKSRSAVARANEGSFPLNSAEAENRLRQAARILANGAIRAALKHRIKSQQEPPSPNVRNPDTTGKTALTPFLSGVEEHHVAAALDPAQLPQTSGY